MQEFVYQARPSQLWIVAENVINQSSTRGQGGAGLDLQHPQQPMDLAGDPGDVAMAEEHRFQVPLQVGGSDYGQLAFAVGIVMGNLSPLPDLRINGFDDPFQGRQNFGLLSLTPKGQEGFIRFNFLSDFR